MELKIVDRPELRVTGVRHVGPYNRLHEAFERLDTIAGTAGILAWPEAAVLGVYHDVVGEVPEDDLRSDAAVSIPDGVVIPDGLVEQRLAAGRYATAVHAGSYDRLAQTWQDLMRAVSAAGHTVRTTPCYEIYHNQPGAVAEDELRTEIFVPIE